MKKEDIKIVLGSASSEREKLLKSWGYFFSVKSADINEKAIRLNDPCELTLALAHAKAKSILPYVEKGSILITTDEVICLGEKIIEKPKNKEELRENFLNYSKFPLEAFTAVVVINISTGTMLDGVDRASVIFSEFSEDVINELVKKEDIYKRAGGFDINDPLLKPFIKEIRGEKETIIGLPKKLTNKLIEKVLN